MVIVDICERMGWDYHTYMDQPYWFIKHLNEKNIGREKALDYKAKKNKHGR